MDEATAAREMDPAAPIGVLETPLERVFTILGGPTGVLKALRLEGVYLKTPWSVNKWRRAGRLPRTEYTGETKYAEALERALRAAGGPVVTAVEILESGRRGADPP